MSKMRYTALQDPSTPFNQDTVSLLPTHHPPYQPYRPPQTIGTIPPSTRHATPPPLHLISWPGIVPSRQQSPVPSLGFRSKLFGNRNVKPYEENLAWANSTQFRSTSDSTHYDGVASFDHVQRPAKQYFRNPRRIRKAWRTGGLARVPWKGVVGLFLVLLCTFPASKIQPTMLTNVDTVTASSASILIAAHTSRASKWPIQPAVYISALDVLTCGFTLYALHHGVATAFWVRLLAGTTIGDVYDSVSPDAGMRQLRWSKAGVASLFTALSLARGPLLQHSLRIGDDKYVLFIPDMIAGAVLSLVATLAILPLYQGYQRLGRGVSLHPLEIARAFGAPLFDGVEGNAGARDVEWEKGAVRVRYGAVERNEEEKVLRVEEVSRVNVRMPREGEIFG
jgi:hypothetical protein